MSLLRDARELWIVLALALAATLAVLAPGADGWQGATDACLVGGPCFCERDRGGWIRQPANTASNLGFVAVGLAIAAHLARERRAGRHPRPGNPMTETRFHPAFYAAVTALLGPGSVALHASLLWWGSVLDLVSMFLFVALLFTLALHRWLRARRGSGLTATGLAGCYLGLNAALLAVKLVHGHGSGAFGLVAVATLGLELRLRGRPEVRSDGRLLAGAVAIFAASFGIWLLSQNGGALCEPSSWLQGHGVWHLGGAATALALYGYLRSERIGGRPDPPARHGAAPRTAEGRLAPTS